MSTDEADIETQALVLPVKAFSDLAVGKAVVLRGGDAILADAVQNVSASADEALLNVWELERFRWGTIFVTRKFLDDGTTAFFLKVRGSAGGPKKDFLVPRELVMKALTDDASFITTALMNDIDAMDWIGRNFESTFSSAVAKAKLMFASKVSEPTKTGPGPLRM